MANKEMYDYLSAVTPDYSTTTLDISPNEAIEEEGENNVVVHDFDDGSESRIVLSSTPVFYVTLNWKVITSEDAGTIIDFYYDSSKGNGTARTFKWQHYDGHVYVVRFDQKLKRSFGRYSHGITSVTFKVLGRIDD